MSKSLEKDIEDFMDEIRSTASSWILVYFNLSNLNPSNQTQIIINKAKQLLIKNLDGHTFRIFSLKNNDLIIFIQNIGLLKIELCVKDLRKLFSNDPLADSSLGKDHFYQTFHLGQSMESASSKIKSATISLPTLDLSHHIPLESAPVLPFDLFVRLQNTLRQADIANFIRKQAICWMDSTKIVPRRLGYEYYLSLECIEEVINSHTHLITDFALFKYLSILFDKKMLEILAKIIKKTQPQQHFYVNLNLRSVVSKEFFEFHNHVGKECVVEIDRTDILWDLDGFFFACDFLRSYKHKVCLDLIQASNLMIFKELHLNCDFYKVIASPDLFTTYLDDFKDFVQAVTPEKIILVRCDTLNTIQGALKLGVTQFQGFLIDSVLRQDKKSIHQISRVEENNTIN